jgi:hypothetical protein
MKGVCKFWDIETGECVQEQRNPNAFGCNQLEWDQICPRGVILC